jgi:hypothetical protein
MTFKQWLTNGWIARHETSPTEAQKMLAVADRDLEDAKVPQLSGEARHNLAYSAARQLAALALAACGYKPERHREHYQAIDSLSLTVSPGQGIIDTLHAARSKRAKSVYDLAGNVSQTEADEMISLAEELRRKTVAWVREAHPDLLD